MVIMGTHSPDIAAQQHNSRYNTRQNSSSHLLHRTSSPAPPPSIKSDPRQQQQQKRPQIIYNLDAEPNPFEQSFLVQSVNGPHDRKPSTSPPSSSRSRKHSITDKPSSDQPNGAGAGSPNKPILPPLASITSPSDTSYAWSANIQNSLRSGPLSPAMLAGPQQLGPSTPSGQTANPNSVAALAASASSSMHPPLFGFDPSGSFRTGLTPSTGLTPLVGGPVAFPPPSPNTAAFLAMVNAGSGSAATITPNTLNALTGVLQQSTATNSTNGPSSHAQQQQQQQHNHSPSSANVANGAPPSSSSGTSHQPAGVAPSSTYNNHDGNQSSYDTASATTHAANGLFLLSQAHQELTKREEAQRQGRTLTNGDASANPTAHGGASKAQDTKKGTKRKSEIPAKPAPSVNKKTKTAATAAAAAAPPPPPPSSAPAAPATRSTRRQSVAASSSNQEEIEEGDYDDDDEEDMEEPTSPVSATGASAGQSGRKKPETEEEKRKNFLERNRQAALKCRQRKKQWLQQLQAKNEYLTNENERLTAALVSSREEIARLSQLVGAAGVGLNPHPHGQGVPSMGGQVGVGGGGNGGNGPQANGISLNHSGYMQHHPVSVPVSLAQGAASVVVPSNPSGAAHPHANGASPPLSTKGMGGGAMGSPRSPVSGSGSEGRSSRGSYRDSNAHVPPGAPSSAAVGAHSRSEYARDMRERELGHAGMRQAVAVNGRGYGY